MMLYCALPVVLCRYLGQAEEQGHYQAPGEPKDSAWKACSEGPSRWAAFYMQDPELNATGATAEQLKLIIGGEASTYDYDIDMPPLVDRTRSDCFLRPDLLGVLVAAHPAD
jgi:hypothetical protein